MQVLVTRPEPQATRTAVLLNERGHRTHIAPLAVIEPLRPELPAAEAVDVVLLTSANAVPALSSYLHLPVYTVGDATAEAARAAGARRVVSADGDWRRLAALLKGSQGPPAGSRLLHLSGTAIAGDLAGAVRAAGYPCERRAVYTVRAADALPPELLHLLDVGMLQAALFFSPLHARNWCRLVEAAGVAGKLAGIRAVCLSEAVAQPLRELIWQGVKVAAAPTLPALIDCLEGPE